MPELAAWTILTRHRRWAILALGILLSLWAVVAGDLHQAARADELDVQVRAVAKRLQCPVCESVSVADSPSELAGQMRAVIRARLEQGETEDQVVRYFVERYGESVLVEPPRHGIGLLVWLGPVVGVLVGLALLLTWLRHARAPSTLPAAPDARPSDSADWQLSEAQRELDELRGGAPP